MAYHLINIETLEHYTCDDQSWIKALDAAKENWWDPDGTMFDYIYETEDICWDSDDYAHYMFTLLISMTESFEWDGNYIEKRNQVVSYEDTIYLASSLEGTDTDMGLIEFITKGSFRICSEY